MPTLTFKTLYVLVFITHSGRELVHVKVTANPTAARVWRRIIAATPWGQKPRHLLRDRDAVYGRDFRRRANLIGIDAISSPIHAPKANAIDLHLARAGPGDCVVGRWVGDSFRSSLVVLCPHAD